MQENASENWKGIGKIRTHRPIFSNCSMNDNDTIYEEEQSFHVPI